MARSADCDARAGADSAGADGLHQFVDWRHAFDGRGERDDLSSGQGAQIDNTLELDVVTGNGDLVTCSDTQNANLFQAVLGGLGQCAIIVRATLKLIPAPANARVFDMIYPALEPLMADFRTLLLDERFSYLEGLVVPLPTGGYVYILEGVSFYGGTAPNNAALLAGLNFIPGTVTPMDETYFAFCDRLKAAEDGLTAIGRWSLPHPWVDLFVPGSQATGFIGSTLAQLTFADVPDFPNLIYGFRKSRMHRPLLRIPDEEVFFLFDVLGTTDPAKVADAVAQNRVFYEGARALGGSFIRSVRCPFQRTIGSGISERSMGGWRRRSGCMIRRRF